MSNLEVLCIVVAGGTVGGIIGWLSWSFGFKRGQREFDSVLTNSATNSATNASKPSMCQTSIEGGVIICICGCGMVAGLSYWHCPECGRMEDF